MAALRYFSVYGPRQRPDMVMHRMFEATRPGGPTFVLAGDGRQCRDFTFVEDVVEQTVRLAEAPGLLPVTVDIGAGNPVSLNEVIAVIEDVTGSLMSVSSGPRPAGDPDVTVAGGQSSDRFVGLRDGLERQWLWQDRSGFSEMVGAAQHQ